MADGYIYALGGLSNGVILGGVDSAGKVFGIERLSLRDPGAQWEPVHAFGSNETARRAFACAAGLG